MPGASPPNPAIYHITHLANLPSIVAEGRVWCDSQRIARSLKTTNVGYLHIKQRRLSRGVPVAALGNLGDYVPFNFCNRSVMLFSVSKGHDNYSGGQGEVVHLVSSVQSAVRTGRPWAFTDRHADLGYAMYFDDLAKLSEVDWTVMPLHFWADADETKDRRQAEFLVHSHFPWPAVERIGVQSNAVGIKVRAALGSATPAVTIEPKWYY